LYASVELNHEPYVYLTTITFVTLSVCGLDHIFIRSGWVPFGLYTFRFLGLARYCHFTGFTEFDTIHTNCPQLGAHILRRLLSPLSYWRINLLFFMFLTSFGFIPFLTKCFRIELSHTPKTDDT